MCLCGFGVRLRSAMAVNETLAKRGTGGLGRRFDRMQSNDEDYLPPGFGFSEAPVTYLEVR